MKLYIHVFFWPVLLENSQNAESWTPRKRTVALCGNRVVHSVVNRKARRKLEPRTVQWDPTLEPEEGTRDIYQRLQGGIKAVHLSKAGHGESLMWGGT